MIGQTLSHHSKPLGGVFSLPSSNDLQFTNPVHTLP